MHSLTYNLAYHVDSTTLTDVRKTLTLLPPTPRKKASLGHNPYFIYTATYAIYIYLCIKFIGIV
jgi:hypothetical protein